MGHPAKRRRSFIHRQIDAERRFIVSNAGADSPGALQPKFSESSDRLEELAAASDAPSISSVPGSAIPHSPEQDYASNARRIASHSSHGRVGHNRSVSGKAPLKDSRGMTICHTQGMVQKIAVTLSPASIADLDRWVREGRYPNRSRALQSAVELLSQREKRTRLARELKKLNVAEERRLAEEGLGDESWPTY